MCSGGFGGIRVEKSREGTRSGIHPTIPVPQVSGFGTEAPAVLVTSSIVPVCISGDTSGGMVSPDGNAIFPKV